MLQVLAQNLKSIVAWMVSNTGFPFGVTKPILIFTCKVLSGPYYYDGFLIGAQTTSAATCLKVSVSESSVKNIEYRETRPTIQPKEGSKWGLITRPGFVLVVT